MLGHAAKSENSIANADAAADADATLPAPETAADTDPGNPQSPPTQQGDAESQISGLTVRTRFLFSFFRGIDGARLYIVFTIN
jgi:hypothetical protein